jgi:homoserine O-acetyltransferase
MLEGFGLPSSSKSLKLPSSFQLERGGVLHRPQLAFNTYGKLNENGDNCILVGHSLTSNSCVHEWWGELIGEGDAFSLDTSKYFVVCVNFLGSVYGSAGPLDILDEKSGKRAAADFPIATIKDNAMVQKALLDQIGVKKVAFAVGGSLGGALALEFAASYPDMVTNSILVATCARHSAWAIGLGEAGRQAIYADPKWKNGYYLADPVSERGYPLDGLSVARQLAMLSYRTPKSFTEKFGREEVSEGKGSGNGSSRSKEDSVRQGGGLHNSPAPFFEVERYLNYQGLKLTKRFDALCYVRLTQLLDSHDIGHGRGGDYKSVLQSLKQRSLIVGIDSDLLYPCELSQEIADLIPNSTLHIISSPHGHDSFLIHIDELNLVMKKFMLQSN